MNPNVLMQIIKSGGNPQAILNNMLQTNFQDNPMAGNIMNMMNSHDAKGLEMVARNLAKSKNINIDKMISDIQNQLR